MSNSRLWNGAVAATCVLLAAGCISLARQPLLNPDDPSQYRDLFQDVQLEAGADVVQLTALEERVPEPPLSDTAPAYKLVPGDVIEIIYHVLPQPREEQYLIEIMDQLKVELINHAEMNRSVVVRPDGKVTLPLIGDIRVIGLSPDDVRKKLNDAYAQYLNQPELSVVVEKHNVKIDELKKAITTAPRGQSKIVPVRPDGKVTLPLIGEVKAAGYTIDEIYEEIQKRYAQYVRDVEVSVILEQVKTPQIFISGQVKNPGSYDMIEQIFVSQALALAGGTLIDADLERVLVVKKHGFEKALSYRVNVQSILEHGMLEKDVLLSGNDFVYVPKAKQAMIYIAGEVNKGDAYAFEPGMDIFDAIALAEGVKDSADLRSVVIMRRSGVARPVAFRVDLTKALYGTKQQYNLALQKGDGIFFPKSFIGRVDQWIDQWLTKGLYAAFPSGSALDFYLDMNAAYKADWDKDSAAVRVGGTAD